MDKIGKYLPFALFLGFLLFGLNAFLESKPSSKNERVYKTVKEYSPFYVDKRFGGLQIVSKEDSSFKEKPDNMTFFKEFERLEKEWGKKHLKLENNTLLILDNNGKTKSTLPLNSRDEIEFVHHYYGVE